MAVGPLGVSEEVDDRGTHLTVSTHLARANKEIAKTNKTLSPSVPWNVITLSSYNRAQTGIKREAGWKKYSLKIKNTPDSNYYVLPVNDALKTAWRSLVTLSLCRYYIRMQLISVSTREETFTETCLFSFEPHCRPFCLLYIMKTWDLYNTDIQLLTFLRVTAPFQHKQFRGPPQKLFVLLLVVSVYWGKSYDNDKDIIYIYIYVYNIFVIIVWYIYI
jgi:hypothetical protein